VLIPLTAEQVNEYWDVLRPMVLENQPATVQRSEAAISNILTSALSGDARFWGYYKKGEESDELEPGKFTALIVTSINSGPVTKLKRLLVFAYWADDDLGRKGIVDGLNSLEDYARENNCGVIYSFTSNPAFERVLGALSWESDTTLIYKAL